MTDDPKRAVLRSPTTWAVTSGLGLLVALVLPPTAPDAVFWGATAVSCAGAALWVIVSQPPEG